MWVSTGAVIDYPVPPGEWRQIDIIIWAPFPAPATFDVERFGLVPRSSAFGVIEVKRSNYHDVERKLEEFLADVQSHKIVADKVRGIHERNSRASVLFAFLKINRPRGLEHFLMRKRLSQYSTSKETRLRSVLSHSC
jgi:hypothetical protein